MALYFAEHTHIPAARQTAWPGGAELPRKCRRAVRPGLVLAPARSSSRGRRCSWAVAGPTVFARVLGFGDVWFDIPVDVIGVPPKPEVIERYEAAGVRRVSWAPSAGRAVADVHGE